MDFLFTGRRAHSASPWLGVVIVKLILSTAWMHATDFTALSTALTVKMGFFTGNILTRNSVTYLRIYDTLTLSVLLKILHDRRGLLCEVL